MTTLLCSALLRFRSMSMRQLSQRFVSCCCCSCFGLLLLLLLFSCLLLLLLSAVLLLLLWLSELRSDSLCELELSSMNRRSPVSASASGVNGELSTELGSPSPLCRESSSSLHPTCNRKNSSGIYVAPVEDALR